MDWETLQATWTALPEATRTAIQAALANGRRVSVLGIVDGTLHFVADDYEYIQAQSGSDWGTHFVAIGSARLDGEKVSDVTLTTEIDVRLSESQLETYRAHRAVEEVRDKALKALGVTPPKPAMTTIVVERCPSCGSTKVDRNVCNVCAFSDDTDWNASHEQRADDATPDFVAPAPSTQAGFELRGKSFETNVLVHHGLGYAIVLPNAWNQGPNGAQSAIVEIDLKVRVIARAAHVEGDVRQALLHAARRRADVVGEILDAPIPKGGTWCGFTTYERSEDWKPWTEMLALSTKGSSAMFLYVGYPTRDLELIPWLNLRGALFTLQTWQPDELDELQAIWPSGGAFSEPKLTLGYVRTGDKSQAKAEELREMSDEPADAVIAWLVREAGLFVAPSAAWMPEDTERVTFAMRECAGRFAPVIVRDLDQAKTMHDFRKWCTLVKWAVENRRRRP